MGGRTRCKAHCLYLQLRVLYNTALGETFSGGRTGIVSLKQAASCVLACGVLAGSGQGTGLSTVDAVGLSPTSTLKLPVVICYGALTGGFWVLMFCVPRR